MNVLEDQQEQFPVAHKKLYILNKRIWDCIQKYHDPPEYGHGGITNTVKTIQRNCYFNKIKNHVTNFIKQCESCQKNKHFIKKKYGNPEIIKKPDRPWKFVNIDFITKLSKSKDPITGVEYDSI